MMKKTSRIKQFFTTERSREIAIYTAFLVVLVVALIFTYQAPSRDNFVVDDSLQTENINQTTALNPVVEIGLALGAAEKSNLPVVNNVLERTSSMVMRQQMAQTEDEAINKTVVDINANSPAILEYTTVEGDNVATLARQFGISKRTIKWANNLISNDIAVGTQIVLPVVDGVVYKVREGDTIESIIEKYGSDRKQILAVNDIDDIIVGEKIVIPGGELPLSERPGYTNNRTIASTNTFSSGTASSWLGIDPTVNVGNAYAFGNCTYYAYNRRAQLGRPVGSFWGNANTWASAAQAAGYVVSGVPIPGAVFQTVAGGYGYGHVGIVESVNDDGSITVSDMNAICGFNCVGTATWPKSQWSGYNFIY